ncbi:hypothetical protein DVH24_003375 [Malus domestica]|uniref:Uncharacterized protein n=1 Tax=Malus domestica TaxID=3750 RepID=A0A498ILD3_MALDO|nr:hypothetical protein DVH24_003375 [Malus domestica]
MYILCHMSNFISNRRAASRDNQTPFPAGSATTTSPPNLDTTDVSLVMPVVPTLNFVHGCKNMIAVQLILELSHFLDSLGMHSYVL